MSSTLFYSMEIFQAIMGHAPRFFYITGTEPRKPLRHLIEFPDFSEEEKGFLVKFKPFPCSDTVVDVVSCLSKYLKDILMTCRCEFSHGNVLISKNWRKVVAESPQNFDADVRLQKVKPDVSRIFQFCADVSKVQFWGWREPFLLYQIFFPKVRKFN